jgi:Flp pilus assembly protein TadG
MPRQKPVAMLARLWSHCSGAALVEFTLVAPLLLTLALGMLAFGRGLYQYQQVVNGVRDAARYLAHQPSAQLYPTLNATLQSQAQTLATKGCLTSCSSVELRVANWHPADVSFNIAAVSNPSSGVGACGGKPCYRGATTLYEVTVTATVNYQDLSLLSGLGLPSIQFHVRHEERNIPD